MALSLPFCERLVSSREPSGQLPGPSASLRGEKLRASQSSGKLNHMPRYSPLAACLRQNWQCQRGPGGWVRTRRRAPPTRVAGSHGNNVEGGSTFMSIRSVFADCRGRYLAKNHLKPRPGNQGLTGRRLDLDCPGPVAYRQVDVDCVYSVTSGGANCEWISE